MKVVEFRYFDAADDAELDTKNWSRAYEYLWAMFDGRDDNGFLKKRWPLGSVVHNTCAGGVNPLHRNFIDALGWLWQPIHSDINPNEYTGRCVTFCDITKPIPFRAHAVLCISALEEFEINDQRIAIHNLLESVLPSGDLLVTADVGDFALPVIEDMLGTKCADVQNRLTGENSVHPQNEFAHLNVIKLHLRKT